MEGCRGCGSCFAFFYDDPVTGDTLCTQCGLVANRDTSLVTGFRNQDHLQDEIMPAVPGVVRRVIHQLGLEPSAQWACEVVRLQQRRGSRFTVERVCEIILNDLTPPEQRSAVFRHKIEPLLLRTTKTKKHCQRTAEKTVGGGSLLSVTTNNASVYDGLLKDLSAFAPELDRRTLVRLSRACEDAVERHPSLQVVLPASVVIATYVRQFHLKESKRNRQRIIASLCTVLDLKACSVNKVLKTISIKQTK